MSCLVVVVVVGVKLNAWMKSAEDHESSPLVKEKEPVVKKEEELTVKKEELTVKKENELIVKKEEDMQLDNFPPSSDFAFTLMKGEGGGGG